jgi:acyl-CoA thioesterase
MTADAKQEQQLAESVVRLMLARDEFSRSLGMSIVEIAPRRSTCRLTVRPDMVNGFGVCHGAVTYALADSALAFACNTHGRVTMAIENSIGYPAAVRVGDVLTAAAVEDSATNRLGFYSVRVTNQSGTVVATFRGTVFRTQIEHLIPNTPKDSAAQ